MNRNQQYFSSRTVHVHVCVHISKGGDYLEHTSCPLVKSRGKKGRRQREKRGREGEKVNKNKGSKEEEGRERERKNNIITAYSNAKINKYKCMYEQSHA